MASEVLKNVSGQPFGLEANPHESFAVGPVDRGELRLEFVGASNYETEIRRSFFRAGL
jgi:hypothetical protein